MKLRFTACIIAALVALPRNQPLNAQGPAKRVTAVTAKGEVVEGTLKSATETAVTIEVAGRPVQIPTDALQYISFVGALPTRGATAPAATSPMNDAFAAVDELKSAAEIGVLRAQWADKLLAAVPRVRAFTKSSPDEWPDVKAALNMAVSEYQGALNNWQAADIYFGDGTRAAKYAKDLAAKPEEKNRKETPAAAAAQLVLGTPAIARLGFGDTTLPDGRYVESFGLSLTTKTRVRLAIDCLPVSGECRPVVSGADGKEMEVGRDYSDSSAPGFKTTTPLAPGAYRVQVTTSNPGAIGLFKLTAFAVK